MSDSSVFLATLGLLTYRLLFHSERQLSLCSLVFCVSCAWCVAQLTLVVFKDEGAHASPPWPSALEGPRLFVASCVKPLCMFSGLSQYARTTCAGFIDLLQGDSGNSAHADADEGARE
jgi:hypothetical protein